MQREAPPAGAPRGAPKKRRSRLSRWLAKPQEPSVTGMMILSGLAGLALARPPPPAALLALATLALHLATFDPAFNAARRRDYTAFTVLAAANSAPYLAAVLHGTAPPAPVAAAAAILATHTTLYARLGPRNPLVYIYGAAIPVLPALALPALTGHLTREALAYWIADTGYSVATAAYIETRLPWRRLNPLAPLAPWIPLAAAAAALEPALLAAEVEPTIKLLHNLARRDRVIKPVPAEIKRLGWTEMYRHILFTGIAVATLTIT